MFDARRLKDAREGQSVSLSQLSKMTGISKSSLQRYETKTTNKVPMEAVASIEKALCLRAGYLMGWESVDISDKKAEFIKRVENMTDEQLDRLEQILALVEGKE